MANVDSFRKQHKEMVEIVQLISSKLTPAAVEAEADLIRSSLLSLSGKLTVHLAMEDKSLYPHMLASADVEIKKSADAFIREMGGLSAAFKAYITAWPNATAIKANPALFCTQSKGGFDALGQRIGREEKTLYPLAEKL